MELVEASLLKMLYIPFEMGECLQVQEQRLPFVDKYERALERNSGSICPCNRYPNPTQ